jgi:hypothetical protein
MFKVTTLPLDGTAPKNEDGSINFKEICGFHIG